MASTGDDSKSKTVTGSQLVLQQKVVACQALAKFRENHEICVQSGFFSKELIVEVDTCALSLRNMGLQTVSVATACYEQWLPGIIDFYKYIDKIETKEQAVDMLNLLGGQADEFSKIFRVIAAWARDLAGKIEDACNKTDKEAEKFLENFQNQVKADLLDVKNEQAKLKEAQDNLEAAQQDEKKWKIAQCATCWNLIGLIVTSIGLLVAEKKVAKEQQLEYQAEKDLAAGQKKLEEAQTKEKEAEYIAKISAKLVQILKVMETTTEVIATFWTTEANTFSTHAHKMIKNEAQYPLIMLKVAISKEDITTWEGAQDDFKVYADAMTAINNSFNFETTAKLPPAQDFKLGKLDFTLSVPKTVDIKKAMAAKPAKTETDDS